MNFFLKVCCYFMLIATAYANYFALLVFMIDNAFHDTQLSKVLMVVEVDVV